MCILFLHYHPCSATGVKWSDGVQCSCPYKLVAAVNRDEFFERTTEPLHFWGKENLILGGRDVHREELHSRGTWLGVSKTGRFAVLTNYRCRAEQLNPQAKTRGLIVSDFLTGATPPQQYSKSLLDQGHDYNGFSAIFADLKDATSELVYCSNRQEAGSKECVLCAGNYGLSNALLDCPWKKVQRGKQQFEQVLRSVVDERQLTDALMQVLADDTNLHPDPAIPDTGYDDTTLRSTTSVFVRPVTLFGHPYGTRTNSVVLWDRNDNVTFTERTLSWPHQPGQSEWTTKQTSFTIDCSVGCNL